MASEETMTIFSSMHEQDDDDDDGDEHDHHHPSSYTMSRLSICTTNSRNSMFDDDDNEEEDEMIMNMSRLYVGHESEVEADGEFSDGKDGKEGSIGSEDFDKETGWFSLPASPYGRIGGVGVDQGIAEREVKEYGSENEGKRGWRRLRERWLERAWEMRKCKAADEEVESISNNPSGESDCAVIARPKRGGKCLCMDIEEVKACRDLGFDLQNEWTLEIPSGISVSSTMDTDSGGNSPISNWRISSAGDDPRDVKARLKVWAQAVALASTYSLSG
ncbi:hypothetical protein CKAN_02446400 [Cinnamomum micranthum f. kanehirae]|uniref:Fold protein n=1 Tax=Cinnamomum micranthum f. kanehirae TaxID=337451 RepID=A0A3S3N9R6_9MAGN|nr:hypothetical protein CKAN_02446400 [Cinnamomum micranthum f. kanehirae]